jgi:hypothetical protein
MTIGRWPLPRVVIAYRDPDQGADRPALTAMLLLLVYAAYIYGLITGLNITGLFQPAGT